MKTESESPAELVAREQVASGVLLSAGLSPLAAIAAWLVEEPASGAVAGLLASIQSESRLELEAEEITAGINDARSEGLDATLTFERLLLQGEWLSLHSTARIRPR